ncbi:hypothetical protein ASE73_07705 [Sphingomonas sp. Leaf24]|nr:hypothetical protein ASE50_16815 [Sphingomonas sp. Leaf5]KQM89461.1 hypothetical protein ASE73_07705 [Sphingomonas sp. Leaf24]
MMILLGENRAVFSEHRKLLKRRLELQASYPIHLVFQNDKVLKTFATVIVPLSNRGFSGKSHDVLINAVVRNNRFDRRETFFDLTL